jgi:hypothetical protein
MQLQKIQNKIYELREQKVILDFDLAEMYDIENKYLKRAVRANIKRFPPDFLIELTNDEWDSLRCKNCTSKRGGTRYAPFAFTEQGVAMLSSVLNSDKAIEVNILIMRAFVLMRQYALSHKDLTDKIRQLEEKYDQKFLDFEHVIEYLLNKDKAETAQKQRKRIGFETNNN